MRTFSVASVRVGAVLASLASISVSSAAVAQGTVEVGAQGGLSTSGAQVTTTSQTSVPKPQAEVEVKTQATLSGTDQTTQADAIARRGNDLAQRLTKMLGEARREKDIMRANCVNRKLTEVNANVRNVDQRAGALKDAAKAGDESRRNHEYTVLSVLSQKFDMLDQEAGQCLGQSVFEPGQSQVVTTVPNNVISVVDPAVVTPPPPPPPAVSIPPETSGSD